jgi:hypothetical protein
VIYESKAVLILVSSATTAHRVLQIVYTDNRSTIMTWQPQQQGLQQVLELLRNAHSFDNEVQIQVQKVGFRACSFPDGKTRSLTVNLQKLTELNQIPDYNNYLIYVLTQLKTEDETVRVTAGLILKNNIVLHVEHVAPQVVEYVKECALSSLADDHRQIRETLGTIITTLVTKLGVKNCATALPRLMEYLESANYSAMEVLLEDVFNSCGPCG